MVCEKTRLGLVLVLLYLLRCNLLLGVQGTPQVPCYFIFGDSLGDSGKNNPLSTKAKANYPPYGIDFPGGATGRFTNGKTAVDIIAGLLGFDHLIPPFATASGQQIITGVNYASGSAGIRDEMGNHWGSHVSLNQQLENHQTTIKNLAPFVGNVPEHLPKCLYMVGIGSNDYINNYFVPKFYNTSHQCNPEQYAGVLIDQYIHQLEALYQGGARKIALIGLGPIGCAPHSIISGGKGACVQEMNSAAVIFNNELKPLVDQLGSKLADSKFIYINSKPTTSSSSLKDLSAVANAGCCPIRDDGQCNPQGTPCANRNEYVFWDGFHPTEATNKVSASKAYDAPGPSDAHPFGIRRLVQQH